VSALPSVMILGEPGTEPFRTAEAIHENSGRSGRYVRVFCRELVGDVPAHAFLGTDAGAGRPGFLEHARGGTLYFEEIAEMPEADQHLLRRILETGVYVPNGKAAPVPFNARLIASTSRSPAQMVLSGGFDAELFRRLSEEVVVVPPLRERGAPEIERIALELADWEPAALALLPYHDWPGNVAELKDLCARARGRVTEADVVARLGVPIEPQARLWGLLRACRGNATAAARRLGVSPSTMYRRMKVLHIPKGAGRCG
jgi:DNA-binding NtrC family response regulator